MDEQIKLYPLSSPQRGIWYLEKMYPNTSIGNISATLKFEDNINYEIANTAFNHILRLNDAIRMRIKEIDGEIYQYISEYKKQKFDYLDFSKKEIGKLYEWDLNMNKIPIYNHDSPLFYFAVIKISDNLAGFYVKLHHMIADAWTLVTFGNEIIDYYYKLLEGKGIETLSKPSYIEYINNEQIYLDSERFLKDEAFWMEKFKKIPELATVKERKTSMTSIRASRKTFVLPEKLSKKIHQHCSKHKTSIFSLYLSAMAIYINRTRVINEVVFGTPVLNRTNFREKETMGMFISTVPIRVNVDESQDYTTFAESINKEWMSILRHQKYPYVNLLKKLREKNPGLEKLYDIVISYQNAKFMKSGNEHSQEGRWHQNGYQTETLYIHLNGREDDGEIIIDYDYLADLFYEKEVEFLHDHVIRLLWHAIDNPAKQLPFIDMVSENEKQKILFDFNKISANYDKEKFLHILFEDMARITPDRTAIVFENEEMTYRELNEKANQLAIVLRRKGVKPNDIVGLMVDRSFELIIGIFGILKAGAAYSPIDKDFPSDRITYILRNSNAKILVTQSSLIDSVVYDGEIIDIYSPEIYSEKCENPVHVNKPDDSAYVIYTSGSTGLPKGVELKHSSLTNFVEAMTNIVDFNPEKTIISITSVSFDIFIFETLLPLSQGLKVVFTNSNEQRVPVLLKGLMEKQKINIIQTTPTRMKFIIDQIECYDVFSDLTDIVLGGEVFKEELLNSLRKITKAKIYNGYGPSETTIYSAFKELTHEKVINIGRPVLNTRAYIVDKYLNLMPIGIIGELCISGAGVMKGYVNQPDMNREKLITNPFETGTMMYKTGDLACWYSEGEIEYIGRNDNQVKINGLRIEFGEIESQLLKQDNIIDAITTINEDASGNPRICAYVVAEGEISILDIKGKLSKKLPHYMLPSHIIRINHIPLTATGKIDRRSLPKPYSDISSETQYEAPRDNIEKILTKTYEKILKHKNIGINDHFFELGGDSLGVIELVSDLYKHNLNLEIQEVYKYPIIRELKQCVQKNRSEDKKIVDEENNSRKRKSLLRSINKNTVIGTEPLYDLVKRGTIPRIDSAALTYIPDNSSIWDHIFNDGPFGSKPVFYKHMSLNTGNIGIIALPLRFHDLYNKRKKTLALCQEAIRMAEELGAKVVSLTGLIPSATRGARDIEKDIFRAGIKAKVTTGHATTASTVILSLIKMLEESNRDIAEEDLCVIGLGSIGTAVVKLLLSVLQHPRTIILCDLLSKKESLLILKEELERKQGYENKIKLAYSDELSLPDEVYNSTLILGATNVPDILDIKKVKPGSLVIDDSGPHCFSVKKAINRILTTGDILVTEGGVLEIPEIINNKIYLPVEIDFDIIKKYKVHFSSENEMTGCILSSLLSVKFDNLKPQTGYVSTQECIDHYRLLTENGYKGAALHCDTFFIPKENIDSFVSRYHKKKVNVRNLR